MGFLSNDEIINLGFKSFGKNIKISRDARFYNPSKISIGDNTRIDDFCVISAGDDGIDIGSFVHISTHVSICGKSNITISDFVGISFKTTILSSNDDYSGEFMTNPTVPDIYRKIYNKPIYIGKHVIIGANSIILPNVLIIDGISIGAFSLVKSNLDKIGIYAGVPCKFIKEKSLNIFELEKKFNSN